MQTDKFIHFPPFENGREVFNVLSDKAMKLISVHANVCIGHSVHMSDDAISSQAGAHCNNCVCRL